MKKRILAAALVCLMLAGCGSDISSRSDHVPGPGNNYNSNDDSSASEADSDGKTAAVNNGKPGNTRDIRALSGTAGVVHYSASGKYAEGDKETALKKHGLDPAKFEKISVVESDQKNAFLSMAETLIKSGCNVIVFDVPDISEIKTGIDKLKKDNPDVVIMA